MKLKYNPNLCLPTPQWYLRRKRQTILTKYEETNQTAKIVEYKLFSLYNLSDDLKAEYTSIDRQLAEIDGRLKKEAEIKKAKISVNNKVTSIGYTTEQIAEIASALNIKI